MGLHSATMAHTLFVVVIVAVLAVAVKSVDYRCRYTETKVDNCTRTIYYPCPEDPGSSEESSEEDGDAPLSRKRRSAEDYITRLMRRWIRRGNSNVNWCEREETFTCVMYRCYIACCPGWKFDEDSQTCSIRENPKPAIECMNGGQAVQGPDGEPRCQCPRMYTGTRCEEVVCTLNCMNDGMCDLVRGQPKCVCSDDFSGSRCENPICEGGCVSGHCVADDGQATCRCQQGYTGRRCETRIQEPEKEGDCPPVTSSTVGTCVQSCHTDSNCPGKMKCCNNGCGQMCAHPANYTCSYNGKNYNIGDIFYPDACHMCTCLTPDSSKAFGGAQCRKPTCPPVKDTCKEVRKATNTCCDYCADQEPTDQYEEPKFINCPESLVTVDVAHDKNEARLPFTLEARDHKDVKLEVMVSRTVFQAGLGEENFETVIATSERDYANKFAQCEFHVRIRDVHAPNFTLCPTDVDLPKEGPATWDVPTAVDNVGLMRPPTSRYKPGDHFRSGEHPIVYSSEDYEGNIARCHFFVKVGRHDASTGERIGDEENHHKKQRHLMFIAGGIAAFLLIIVIIIVAVLCRRRRGSRRDAAAPPPAYENGIYNVGAVMPPPYKEKPPVYVSESETVAEKKMEEADKTPLDVGDVDLKLGVDNPTYRL